jgi:hypothetical protein
MEDWSLDELATSFAESGFWPQEALIVVRESLPEASDPVLIVIEGNRRLAALKKLQRAAAGESVSAKWKEIVGIAGPNRIEQLFDSIPYIEMPDRRSVQAYLGFRHVTGIKEWSLAEKA